jgi:cyclophilin family peptidyl-prolyl cis-trans isomerase
MVPLRAIFEALGATVDWDPATMAATAVKGNTTVVLKIGSLDPTINGIVNHLDVAGKIVDGRTLVPLRFISQAFGAKVLWNSTTSTARISNPNNLPSPAARNNKYQSLPKMSIDPNKSYTAEVETNRGTFSIKLLASAAPVAVNNFVFLAREGFYNGICFHRIVQDFIIQTGDPLGNGTGGPGYKFNDELPPAIPYASGVVAMANQGANTNGSQFFICSGDDAKSLNGIPDYTVFGEVIEGMDVVQKIATTPVESNGSEQSKPMEDIVIKQITIKE